ncbi:MAG TPA: hypothetical protein VFZ80_02715 [Acidimicrobiia bacterium]
MIIFDAVVKDLRRKGVRLKDYELPGYPTQDRVIADKGTRWLGSKTAKATPLKSTNSSVETTSPPGNVDDMIA